MSTPWQIRTNTSIGTQRQLAQFVLVALTVMWGDTMNHITEKVIQSAVVGDLAVLRGIAKQHGVTAVKAEGAPDELTAIHVAAAAGREDIVRFSLSGEIGADPRTARDNNFAPLHAAAMQDNARICQLLLDNGADPNAQTDPLDYSPLHSAAWRGHVGADSSSARIRCTDRPAHLPWRNPHKDREATEANRRRGTTQGQNAPQKLVAILVIVVFES